MLCLYGCCYPEAIFPGPWGRESMWSPIVHMFPPLWPWGDNLCTPGSRTPRFGSKQKGGFLTSPLLLQLNIGHGHGPEPGPGSAAA